MSDKIFFHPETGKPLHRVPDGATIPKGTPFGYASGQDFFWLGGGSVFDRSAGPGLSPRFTAEPIPPPLLAWCRQRVGAGWRRVR